MKLTSSILFACDRNTIRYPLAATIMRREARLQAFRDVRQALFPHIRARFADSDAPV